MSRRMRKVARLLAASVVVAAAAGCDTAYPDSPLEWKSESAGPLASASVPKKKPAKPAPTAGDNRHAPFELTHSAPPRWATLLGPAHAP